MHKFEGHSLSPKAVMIRRHEINDTDWKEVITYLGAEPTPKRIQGLVDFARAKFAEVKPGGAFVGNIDYTLAPDGRIRMSATYRAGKDEEEDNFDAEASGGDY